MAKIFTLGLAALSLQCGTAAAQAPAAPAMPVEFPAAAAPLEASALQQRLTGKVFRVAPRASAAWRMQFNSNGYFYLDTESGYRDSGKWRVEASALCTEPQKTRASCNEMRLADDALYLKRDSGEIVKFEPK